MMKVNMQPETEKQLGGCSRVKFRVKRRIGSFSQPETEKQLVGCSIVKGVHDVTISARTEELVLLTLDVKIS
jgi:hypothetical protein